MIEHVSTSITTIKTLLIAGASDQAVLTPNPYGFPLLLEPQPILLRAHYIEPGGDREKQIQVGLTFLDNAKTSLLAPLAPQSSARELMARIFTYEGEERLSLSQSSHGRVVRKFGSPGLNAGHSWVSDWRQSKPGFFLTGHSSAANLWRIERMDIDGFGSIIFTLGSSMSVGGLPRLSLDSIGDPLLRGEIGSHYDELQRALVSLSYRGVMTHARSISEAVLGYWIARNGQAPGKDLAGHLDVLRQARAVQKAEVPWFSDLAYHCAQRIRLLHARTHADRTVKQGRPVEPELAGSCIEDLKEILRETGLT